MEEPIPPLIEAPPQPPPPPGMSLAARLLNVFAIPGQVFGELKTAAPAASNWLVPAVLTAVIGVFSALIILSQPAVQKQFRERQAKFMQDGLENQKLTPQERHLVEVLTSPQVLKAAGVAGAVIGSFGSVLWWGFVLWFLARALLRVPVPFVKTLEVAGLSTMISVLGGSWRCC